jgi:hypothetical protein
MLQSVATLISVFIAVGMVAVISAILADDWVAVARALGRRAQPRPAIFPAQSRADGRAKVRVVRVSSQSAPMRAAA